MKITDVHYEALEKINALYGVVSFYEKEKTNAFKNKEYDASKRYRALENENRAKLDIAIDMMELFLPIGYCLSPNFENGYEIEIL